MDKIKSAKERLQLAIIERDIRETEHVQTIYDKFNGGIRNTIIAIGGRTYLATLVAMFTIPLMTGLFYFWTKNISYFPLLVGCGFETLSLMAWIYRHQQVAKISAAGGSIEFDDPEVEKLNPNKQRPSRARIDTAFNEDMDSDSEVVFKTDG